MLCGICNDIQRGQFISINHFLVWHAEVAPSTIDSLTLIRFARFMRKLSDGEKERKERERETRAKQTRKPGRQCKENGSYVREGISHKSLATLATDKEGRKHIFDNV